MDLKKIKLPQEVAYLLGIVTMTLGVALMQKADFGLSMIVAPAYMLSEFLGITFGTAEYCLQFVLVTVMCLILRRFRLTYYLSFATAVLYGLALDGFIWLLQAGTPAQSLLIRILLMLAGMVVTAVGVALFFNTYLPACAYDMFVKVMSGHFGIKTGKFKICYDFASLAVSLIMAFLFFGKPIGIGVGTLICACLNGLFINSFSAVFARCIEFTVILPKAERFFK